MKNIFLIFFLLSCYIANTQVSGNANVQEQVNFNEENTFLPTADKDKISVNIKCLANVKVDNYVAIFSLTQVGKTLQQTDSLFNERLKLVEARIAKLESTDLFVDLVSYLPVYATLQKRSFSNDSKTEEPKGFELKKNLHIQYKNQTQLNTIISICAEAEIYHLIKVDCFSTKMDEIKLKLQEEARKKLTVRLAHYESILGNELETFKKRISDAYQVEYPTERYQSIATYNNKSLKISSSSRYGDGNKNQILFYQPIANKDFDFVLNPIVKEPVIQVMYELNLSFFEKPTDDKNKDFLFLTPNGELKPIALK